MPNPPPSLATLQATTEGLFPATLGVRLLAATPDCTLYLNLYAHHRDDT